MIFKCTIDKQEANMKREGLFWGGLLVVLGVLLLLENLGLFPPKVSAWGIFWAVVLIWVGVRGVIAGLGGRANKIETVAIPIGQLSAGDIQIEHGAGRLNIDGSAALGNLLNGQFSGGVSYRVDGSKVFLSVLPHNFSFWGFTPYHSLDWSVGLTRSIPISLRIQSGASDNRLNLIDLRVTKLRVEVGASSTRMTLPNQAGQTKAILKSGAAAMKVEIPEGVAGRISVQSGLASITINSRRFPLMGNYYQSSDYDTAQNRVDISVETGVGSVEII